MHVDVRPELLRWARERANLKVDDLVRKFSKYREWESGNARPTLKQLERFAKITYAPVGCLFLSEPMDERVPIPDFRTVGGSPGVRPSPNLLDTVYLCQQRQEWYRDFARIAGEDRPRFVGSVSLESNPEDVAEQIRTELNFGLEERREVPTWADALRRFIEKTDALGVLVMVNGVVGNNTHRKLDPDEFRGFALVDEFAPLVFINGADAKAAQIFTLAHELAHIWLGESALSGSLLESRPPHRVEAWCNRAAAELLVPRAVLREEYRQSAELSDETERLARLFKVSALVVLCRLRDVGFLTPDLFRQRYEDALSALKNLRVGSKSSGGNFYATQTARVGKRFARALVVSTLEGRTLYRDALHLLGFSKIETFRKLAGKLGVV